jgi:hypothetical protein
MSLPARQQRVINELENAPRASEPRLASMYAIFARLNQNEPVAAEPLTAARRRRRVPGDAMFAIVLVPVLFTIRGATATGQAGSAAKSAGAARFVTRTASEQALSPPSATSDTSGVC